MLDNSTGYLVSEGDSIVMAEHLLIDANSPIVRRCMGETACWRAKQNFTWEKERVELLRILGSRSSLLEAKIH